MTPHQKKRVVLYGVLLSAVHFAAAGFCHAIPTQLMRPEDMSTGPIGKPTWPVYPLGEALERVGDVLVVPFDWMWNPWMVHHLPEWFGILLFAATSCLWGFTLAATGTFFFIRVRSPRTTLPDYRKLARWFLVVSALVCLAITINWAAALLEYGDWVRRSAILWAAFSSALSISFFSIAIRMSKGKP